MEEALRKLIQEGENYVDVTLYVKPEARFTGLKMETGELVFYTDEPPIEGRANASLVRFFARLLKVPTSRVEIVYGARSRTKKIRIHGVTADQVIEKIIEALRETEARA
ncbi:hypothetical protein PYJP_10100 [Pyrofollis japonicus]|uniref:DUF167 domain-containing protein n=1 Tax=Pyrofollis japonicus TaxID=3060460 RepID=UPI00295A96DC|nr:DUF167 domain-containing protein [Pyrofollis japonicus]BEP17658.1 hypothetical protein PYJP_10100 [Pyrofollis japonicus]